ncbi:Hypothetical protein CINCED_3A004152 [Cinara cedri]|uniref:Proactivator polypeptide n=1 Tax=Cinara cedri TaxID=506608 RepID=A0A5E4M2T8_9HEMI|nr:Hypothetical protein CINCED_3A004152 [Cinara cedri]
MSTAGSARLFGALAVFGLVFMSSGTLAEMEMLITQKHVSLVGVHECTYGPSYWCRNITNAASCNAVKHCIQTTWETQTYPEDNDDVCTICKNMVKEARDTLESNTTLDELKQVFYGSCQLLPLKVIKTECKKLADDFIPELVDTLASQMDPNVVCTVSGLCNNAHIDKLLLENKEQPQNEINDYHACEKCAIVMEKGEHLMESMSEDEVLNKMIMLCGELSSYSDVCIDIVYTYRLEIYRALKNDFNKRNVCMLSGMCSEAFHPHADGYERSKNALMGVEISNAGERGRVQIKKSNEVSDDVTCDFCEAMVKHLRDILISNTTEEQFLDVLKGLCKQTKSFSDECLAMVVNNYGRIYQFLVNELNGKKLCTIVGVCSKSQNSHFDLNFAIPMYPLLPIEILQKQEAKEVEKSVLPIIVDEQPPKVQNIKPIKKSPVIDVFYKEMHIVVNDVDLPTDKTICFLCESILNYVQQEVTDPKSESEIRTALKKSCLVLPSLYEDQCKQFVDQYGDAFISLVAQEVDPSIICPELKACPSTDLSVTFNKGSESSNNCQMCVIFMSTLESEITKKDSEEVIKKKLEKLCGRLPQKWKKECNDFVSTQLNSILDMLVAEVKPEEICVMLEVCKPKLLFETSNNDIDTNMVASSGLVTIAFPGYDIGKLLTNNHRMLEEPKVPTPFCLVCTIVMKYLNNVVKDKSNQEEIEQILDSVCRVLPNVEETECQNFVDSNYKNIVTAIQIGTDPGIACMALMVCDEVKTADDRNMNTDKRNLQSITFESVELDKSDECAACEAFTAVFSDRLNNNSVDIDLIDIIEFCDEVDVKHKNKYGCKLLNQEGTQEDWLIKNLVKMLRVNCKKSAKDLYQNKFHPKCSICKDVIRDIKNKIETSKLEKDVMYRLESLCDPLPNKAKCIDFVESNAEKMMNTLINDIKEESICAEIGYC